jgi:hypothetical protein
MELLFGNVAVSGISHYLENARQLKEGDVVDLVPEPENKYDPDAIRIEYHNKLIGYIPKELTEWVHIYLDCTTLEAKVKTIYDYEHFGVRLEIWDLDDCEAEGNIYEKAQNY